MDAIETKVHEIIRESYPNIKKFNPAQQSVIDSGYLEDKTNYIIAIPTASGKTVLGVMAALTAILKGGKAVYAVPLISIQNEKVKEFKKFEKYGIKVGKHPSSSDLAVMVFESFDAITRFSWNTLNDVDLLVVDEFHMIGEYSRGPTMECAITRSKQLNPGMRIVALSATLQNMGDLSSWLDAHVVEHDFRPVPLYKDVLTTEEMETKNKNDVIVKILNTSIKESSQALVFVSTRRFTESLAKYTSDKVKRKLSPEQKKAFHEVSEKILDVPRKRGSLPTAVCLKLAESIENGVAFHHAGLFDKQKEIIEDEFRAGNLLMITATPSLMYGVNLPSKNVVIRDYTRWTSQGPQPIPVFDYEQMSGRAGRPGYDTEGYSYLIAKTLDEAYNLKDHYVYGEIEPTNSKLIENKDAVYRQIITQVASTLAKTPKDLFKFFLETFYGWQMSHNEYLESFCSDSIEYEVNTALEFLVKNGIIMPTPDGLKTTEFGMLIAKSNYTVETAVRLREFASVSEEIESSKLIYELSKTPDMPLISFKGRKSKEPVRDRLNSEGIFVVDIGLSEATAATMLEWMGERNEYEIENAFNVYAASTRRSAYEASLLVKFFRNICNILNIYSGTDQLDMLAARLYYGVKPDLVPLVVSVKRLGRKRARAVVKVFGDDLKHVTPEKLTRIDGIGPKTAEAIIAKFGNG
ncbi:DEAD/DEAH box helicase domain protein [Methanobacterium lacus]|uniref:ATP-dependent DNA helicase Hel308 n=2 Tax=Methanobacterium lacus (strain AL-21) TaxID=877455 RepID=F0TAY9_METLA|nr:DEAD/DEAH box helicase [Methanobacterium lacus]ADZ10135.1 DEAD/DEAH box helicase domain protein [Methanobacterium lacus]